MAKDGILADPANLKKLKDKLPFTVPQLLFFFGILAIYHFFFNRELSSSYLQTAGGGSLKASGSEGEATKPSRFLIDNYGFRGPVSWKEMRPEVQQEFLLDGQVQLFCEERRSESTSSEPPFWKNETIDAMMYAVSTGNLSYTKVSGYGEASTWEFIEGFQKYPIKGKSVLVVGSQRPWVEAICLVHEAGSVTTIDFNVPIVERNDIRTISIEELDSSDDIYDVIISYSSMEHDGLGRYGDPMNPNADIERMQKLRGLVKSGGHFFLGVPLGPDRLCYNLHRVYGPIRYSRLTAGWKVLHTFGGKPYTDYFKGCSKDYYGQCGQPLVLLEKPADAS